MFIFMIGVVLLPMFYKSTFGRGRKTFLGFAMDAGDAIVLHNAFKNLFSGRFNLNENAIQEQRVADFHRIGNQRRDAKAKAGDNPDLLNTLLYKIPGMHPRDIDLEVRTLRNELNERAAQKAREEKIAAEKEQERLNQIERERINREKVRRETEWARMGLTEDQY